MKIITWNINSVRLRIKLLEKLCIEQNPDIICLQETKTEDKTFPLEAIKALGYEHVVYSGEKSYNGVAIISKQPISKSFSLSLYNDHKRHICAQIGDIEVHNFYVPAGGDEPDIELNPKYKHKLEYIDLMHKWLASNKSKSDKIILVGDLNIAPHEHDVWSSRQLRNVISHTEPERTALLALQDSLEFIDTGRYFVNMSEKLYSWWSYRNRDWTKSNRGRRLDHIWVTQPLKDNLKSINSFQEARSWEKPSDHAPFILDML
ncbi:MAG: exodeoxyribonuclease III [Rickettsiales bacterium]|nr:MAG: exodeoxyribonuclease III [Rickettsiales bacterium]